jgi:hypothetical protein
MTVIEWDKTGERTYQTGVDRGVLYLKDWTVFPWNGLTSVEDNSEYESASYYLDGVKILGHVTPGDFVGKLSAFTYPREFDKVSGIVAVAAGLTYYEQPHKMFNLSYRTKIGSDTDEDLGYEIHLLYNLTAVPDSKAFQTVGESVEPTEFAWTLTGVPQLITGNRPTVHISAHSIESNEGVFEELESILYGTDTEDPRFPTVGEIKTLYGAFGSLIITDNGDGTWTAADVADDYITMLDATTFLIQGADAEYLDANTYEISSTNAP